MDRLAGCSQESIVLRHLHDHGLQLGKGHAFDGGGAAREILCLLLLFLERRLVEGARMCGGSVVLVGRHRITTVGVRDQETSGNRRNDVSVGANASTFGAAPWAPPDGNAVVRDHQIPTVPADHMPTDPGLACIHGVSKPAHWALEDTIYAPVVVLQLVGRHKSDDSVAHGLLLSVVAVVRVDVLPQHLAQLGVHLAVLEDLTVPVRLVHVPSTPMSHRVVSNLWITDRFQSENPPLLASGVLSQARLGFPRVAASEVGDAEGVVDREGDRVEGHHHMDGEDAGVGVEADIPHFTTSGIMWVAWPQLVDRVQPLLRGGVSGEVVERRAAGLVPKLGTCT